MSSVCLSRVCYPVPKNLISDLVVSEVDHLCEVVHADGLLGDPMDALAHPAALVHYLSGQAGTTLS